MKINTIIFDLGGVLIDWNPKYLYRKIFDTEEEVNYFLNNIATSDWNEEQDAGRSFEDATRELLDKFPEEKWKDAIIAFYGRWTEMLGGQIDGTVDILKKCIENKNYRVLALTNWSRESWPIALDTFDFLHWFEGVLVSGEEGIRKPADEFYQLMMDRYQIDKSTAIFIDDNQRNVDASNEFGLKAIVFKNAAQLKADLHELNILKA